MKLLLDTHIALWALEGNKRLPGTAHDLISNPANFVHVSIVSAWEVALKHEAHPDAVFCDEMVFMDLCEQSSYVNLLLQVNHLRMLHTLQRFPNAAAHKDPFDRMLIAQAKAERMKLLTHDSLLRGYNEPCVVEV